MSKHIMFKIRKKSITKICCKVKTRTQKMYKELGEKSTNEIWKGKIKNNKPMELTFENMNFAAKDKNLKHF